MSAAPIVENAPKTWTSGAMTSPKRSQVQSAPLSSPMSRGNTGASRPMPVASSTTVMRMNAMRGPDGWGKKRPDTPGPALPAL